MSATSTIEWTDATWNPVRGCTKIAPGCKHCYAQTFAERFRGVPGHPYERGFDIRIVPEKLADPLRWGTPKTIFVNSMSDLFHDGVSDEYIEHCVRVMMTADWHVYQVLTKRSERMRDLLKGRLAFAAQALHIWWGVSVENRKHGLPRVRALQEAPATVRFLSVEPLLEEIGEVDLTGIDWVIVGGESGNGARPIQDKWVRDWRDQCKRAGVKFFFKQWGGTRKSEAGRMLDGRTHDDMPEQVRKPVLSRVRRDDAIERVERKAGIWRELVPLQTSEWPVQAVLL